MTTNLVFKNESGKPVTNSLLVGENELIKITEHEGRKAVSARELHTFFGK